MTKKDSCSSSLALEHSKYMKASDNCKGCSPAVVTLDEPKQMPDCLFLIKWGHSCAVGYMVLFECII